MFYTKIYKYFSHNKTMKLDTTLEVSIRNSVANTWQESVLQLTKPLRTYSGNQLDLLGELEITVKY